MNVKGCDVLAETWKDIKGYEGFYKISNYGNVMSLPRNGTVKHSRILKQNTDKCGYKYVNLQKLGKSKTEKVHRLVANNFIPNTQNKREVNHKDGNKANNRVDNLEWVTTSENQLHSIYALDHSRKQIVQYTIDGKAIKVWKSLAKAAKALKICGSDISRCCNGIRATAGGYKWRFEV